MARKHPVDEAFSRVMNGGDVDSVTSTLSKAELVHLIGDLFGFEPTSDMYDDNPSLTVPELRSIVEGYSATVSEE